MEASSCSSSSLSNFSTRVDSLLEKRLDLIPWHVSNVGPLVEQIKRWELTSVFRLLSPEASESVLCVEDTLGILSYLLLPFCKVTYNSVRDTWDFKEQPSEKLICDLSHLPPKHPILRNQKFDKVVLLSLLDIDRRRRDPLLYAVLKMLAPGGCIVASFTTCQSAGEESAGGRHRVSETSWAGLLRNFRLTVDESEALPSHLAGQVSGSMLSVRLTRR